MKWTDEQKRAIEYSGNNVLLSAAAGSGKTAVLVERVIEKLTSPENPISIDTLLVLTFTDAAAAEMRRKISDALDSALLENPQSEHLRRQRLLMTQSHISTIHSFCMEILRSNIQNADIPADFSIIDDTENKLLLNRAVDEVLNRYYARIDDLPGFAALTLGYGGTKNDNTLRECVIRLYHFSRSMPNPSKWLCGAADMYKDTSVWELGLCREIISQLKSAKNVYSSIAELIDSKLPSDHPYAAFIAQNELPAFDLIPEENEGYDEVYTAAKRIYAAIDNRLPGAKNVTDEEAAVGEQIKTLRSDAKKRLKTFLNEKIPDSKETLQSRCLNSYRVVKTLKNIVLSVIRKHKKLKRHSNKLDFSDLEHEAFALLTDNRGEPGEIARGLREKFSEILIDEYQDTSNLQEAIFDTLSNGGNKFMVGDMKQSIYGFRNASPALFLEKYRSYNGEAGVLLRLSKNFRSRENIVNTVNHIFGKIMSEDIGDVKYEGGEMLFCGADYPEPRTGDDETEFIIADLHDEQLDPREVEAKLVASRIKKLVEEDGMLVTDGETRQLRPIRYGDIALLMRGNKRASVYADAMSELDIPSYSEAGHSFLNAVEVQTVLSFLQIIDNPYQDIPLLAVLRSPMFDFSADELARIRAAHRRGNFYTALKEAAESNENAAEFIKQLTRLREMSADTPIDTLIWHILNDFGYYAAVGAMENGHLRHGNLRLLLSHAADFERTRMSGLFNFMNYLETLKTADADLTPSKELETDSVHIMTFHKSKGLEFPVVILADTFSEFLFDSKNSIVWHEKYGIGLDFVDIKRRIRYPSAPKTVLNTHIKRETLSEEMRLLYVSMTRAKEKLIVFCGYRRSLNKSLSAAKCGGILPTSYIENCQCCRDWILPAIIPDNMSLAEITEADGTYKLNGGFSASIHVISNAASQEPARTEEKDDNEGTAAKEFDRDKLFKILSYTYKDAPLGKIPAKLSVSELKQQQMADDDVYVPKIASIEDITLKEPRAETGRERGTITHFVMQHLSPAESDSSAKINAQIQRMVTENMITEEQSHMVDTEAITAFFESEIGRRLINSDEVRREFKFYTELEAGELYPEAAESGATILLQGVVDCFFTEGDGVVILDYKTDNVTSQSVQKYAERYRTQLEYYERGISRILKMPVVGKYLYFFACGATIEMQ